MWLDNNRKPLGHNLAHWDALVGNLESVGLADRIIDITPRLKCPDEFVYRNKRYTSIPRGEEIKRWIKDNVCEDIYKVKFVILDDDADMVELTETHLAQCDFMNGITDEVRDLAIKILNGENNV
jgi:hypothetical protein